VVEVICVSHEHFVLSSLLIHRTAVVYEGNGLQCITVGSSHAGDDDDDDDDGDDAYHKVNLSAFIGVYKSG